MVHIRRFINLVQSRLFRCFNEVDVINVFLLSILIIITIYPLFSGGFTNHDDVFMALNKWDGNTWEMAKVLSMGQGRFAFFWSMPLAAVPYIFDNQIWYLSIKFGAFVVLLASLYYAVFKLFRSNWIALATLTFFLAIVQNGWEYNALTSYPLLFNSFAAMFLLSLGLFATAIDRNSLFRACLAGILYFFTFGVELFVLFFPFYIILLLSRVAPGRSILKDLKLNKKYILAVMIPWISYLIIYFIWRYMFPSKYDGNNLDGLNLVAAAKVIATFSLSAFPLASLHAYAALGDPLAFTSLTGFRAVVSGFNVASFIKMVVVGFLFARLMTTPQYVFPRTRVLLSGASLAFIGIFLPNLLIGFTLRNQAFVAGGTHSYVYTYYSFISAMVFLALVFAYLRDKSRLWNSKLRLAFVLLVVVLMMTFGFAVEVRNQYLAFDQKLAQQKWRLMDEVIESASFREIPDSSTVVAPTLLLPLRGIATANLEDWSNYVKYKTGKTISFSDIDTRCVNGEQCYKLVFRQELNMDNQFMILEKIDKSSFQIYSELTIYSMPVQEGAIIIGSFISSDVAPELKLNGNPIVNIGSGVFSLKLPDTSNALQIAKVAGGVEFISERITISNYNIEPSLRSLSDELADGIDFKNPEYPYFLIEVSGLSGSESWGRWTDAALSPAAKLRFRQLLPDKFTLEIVAIAIGPNTGKPIKVRVGSVEKNFVIIGGSGVYSMIFETDGTVDTIEIVPPEPISQGGDPRKLGIGLINLKIKEESNTSVR